jgi:hypothetical protein
VRFSSGGLSAFEEHKQLSGREFPASKLGGKFGGKIKA